jgi:hypothetical protein
MWNLLKMSLTMPAFLPQGLNRVDSMGSLGHRTLLTYIENEDLGGLKNFLDSRQTTVDDRDENGTTALMVNLLSKFINLQLKLKIISDCIKQRSHSICQRTFESWS